MNPEVGALIALFIAGSLVVTKTIDFIRAFDKNYAAPIWVWIGGSFLVGIAYTLGWHVNYVDAVTHLVPALVNAHIGTHTGEVLTGLAFGAGADFWHKVLANISAGTTKKLTN